MLHAKDDSNGVPFRSDPFLITKRMAIFSCNRTKMKHSNLILILALAGFRLAAQCPPGESLVTLTTTTLAWGEEVGWQVQQSDGTLLYTFQADAADQTYTDEVCLADGCYYLLATDTYGDGWNGGTLTAEVNGVETDFALTEGDEALFALGVNDPDCLVEIWGCTDPSASNYDPSATADDGSCLTAQQILDEQSITWLIQSGPKDNRINWAIQNRGMPFSWDEFPSEEVFVQTLTDSLVTAFTVGHPLEKEPYARYRNFFNLQAWWWEDAPSTETGWNWPMFKDIRDLYFLPWADDEHGWATLFSISATGGGGGAGVQPETRTGDGLMFGSGWETLLHEFGHTMPQVPDEYTASGEWSGGECWETANTSPDVVRDSIPWRLWIEPSTELPTPYVGENLNKIGAFEGALTNYFGCHRPTARGCYMGAGGFGWGFGDDMCAPCRQRVVSYLYRYVDVIENPVPATEQIVAASGESIAFGADLVKPEPNTQFYTWYVNGQPVQTGSDAFSFTVGSCDSYSVVLHVEDTTSWVRYDPLYDHVYPKPEAFHTWQVTNPDGFPGPNPMLTANMADCTGTANGSVWVDGTGGSAPYSAWWNGTNIGTAHEGLSPGEYSYWVTDANGCGQETTVDVGQEAILDVQVCSSYDEGWQVTAESLNYTSESLTFDWDGQADGPVWEDAPLGTHTLTISTNSGCQVEQTFSLSAAASALVVSHEVSPAALTDGSLSEMTHTGRIEVTHAGGVPDYSISWQDFLAQDQTSPQPSAAIASGSTWGHLPEMAFDNNIDEKWLHAVDAGAWIGHVFDAPMVVKLYTITSGDDVPERDPKDWEFHGSNDGTNWTLLDSRMDQDFPLRRQVRTFATENTAAYTHYRIFITANNGDIATQLQELEFVAHDFNSVPNAPLEQEWVRTGLAPGAYVYTATDGNNSCVTDTVVVCGAAAFQAEGLYVVQESVCTVTVEEPQVGYDYIWFADKAGTTVLGTGNSFTPPASGNYWVAAVDQESGGVSINRPGFAVQMPALPEVTEVSEGVLGIVAPDPDFEYRWYTQSCGGTPVAVGNTFTPGAEPQNYFVTAYWAAPFPDPIDPLTVDNLIVRMDASDLNGDGVIDDPAPASSSLLGWEFYPNGQWNDWFAYRSNYQNGLGIADWATLWFQCSGPGFSNWRTVLMAYRENLLSFAGSSPFYGTSAHIPYSAAPDQAIFSADDISPEALNGSTWLNGVTVDPLSTPHPMDWSVLGQQLTANGDFVDCTDTHWEGQLGEMLFFSENPSDAAMIGMSEYLRKKWISRADLENRQLVVWDGNSMGIEAPSAPTTHGLRVYPNPTGGWATVAYHVDERSKLYLCDLNGRKLFHQDIQAGSGFLELSPWLSRVSRGTYLMVIEAPGALPLVERLVRK